MQQPALKDKEKENQAALHPGKRKFVVKTEVQVRNWLKNISSQADRKVELRNKMLKKDNSSICLKSYLKERWRYGLSRY